MAESHKSSEILEAESNLRVVQIMERVEEVTGSETVETNKDIVAFVGHTKSGKSTLINCLLGTQLTCKIDERTGDTIILKAHDVAGPKIGLGGEAETEKPESYLNVPDTNYTMWDFAGFGDNKGTIQEIVNAISYQLILRPQNSVRFVLVATYDLIKAANPLPFYKVLYELSNICPQIGDSLCIVSTKDEKCRVKRLLQTAKSQEFKRTEKTNMDVINVGKEIIRRVLEKGTYVDFNAPVLKDEVDEAPFILPNKQEFIDCIKKLNGARVKDVPLVISDTAKHDIVILYDVFYHEVKREVEAMSASIDNYIQQRINEILEAKDEDGNQTSVTSRLALFKVGKQKIVIVIEKSKNFKEFLVQVKEAGVLVNERFLQVIDKFIFVENLKNMYKMPKDKTGVSVEGEVEFFKSIQVALNSGAQKYSSLIANSAVASEEEKRKEEEWQKHKNDEMNSLRKQIENLESQRNNELNSLQTQFGKLKKDYSELKSRHEAYKKSQEESACIIL